MHIFFKINIHALCFYDINMHNFKMLTKKEEDAYDFGQKWVI